MYMLCWWTMVYVFYSGNIRYFCGECGCHLYAYDKKWSEFVYPYACAIDTPLPELDSKDVYHIMLDSKANWVQAPKADEKQHAFKEYPDCSLEDWHKNNKQYIWIVGLSLFVPNKCHSYCMFEVDSCVDSRFVICIFTSQMRLMPQKMKDELFPRWIKHVKQRRPLY